ncbi:MAG: hypothetical protein KAV87_31380 [Desulfobacteraceae bacterium]|nr:hypothetical protein [Desulfobacteraceae bacterium]
MSADMKIPEYFEDNVFVLMCLEGYEAGNLTVHSYDRSSVNSDYTVVGKGSVRIKLDQSIDPRSVLVDSLTDQKEKVLADAHIKARAIQHKIDDLLQIEYKEVSS